MMSEAQTIEDKKKRQDVRKAANAYWEDHAKRELAYSQDLFAASQEINDPLQANLKYGIALLLWQEYTGQRFDHCRQETDALIAVYNFVTKGERIPKKLENGERA